MPAMIEAELKEAILLPAMRAARGAGMPNPLDQATVELLVQETIGRAGALPLLQFALNRIWDGLAKGKAAAETLRELGGVGGALAAEADRLLDDLGEIGQGRPSAPGFSCDGPARRRRRRHAPPHQAFGDRGGR